MCWSLVEMTIQHGYTVCKRSQSVPNQYVNNTLMWKAYVAPLDADKQICCDGLSVIALC